MDTALDEGQMETVMVPVKKVNKLNDIFKKLKARAFWVKLSLLLLYFTELWPQWIMVK